MVPQAVVDHVTLGEDVSLDDYDDDNISDYVIANDGDDTQGTGNLPQLVVSDRSPRL